MWQMYSREHLIARHWIASFKMASLILGEFYSNGKFLEKEYNEN